MNDFDWRGGELLLNEVMPNSDVLRSRVPLIQLIIVDEERDGLLMN